MALQLSLLPMVVLAPCSQVEEQNAGKWLFGLLGNGTNNWSLTPVDVSELTQVIAIAGGDYHTCALTSNGG